MIPKLLQRHGVKENRPIEEQLNEAKKLATFFIVYAFAWLFMMLVFLGLKILLPDLMGLYIRGFKDIADIFMVLAFVAYLVNSLAIGTDKYVEECSKKHRK